MEISSWRQIRATTLIGWLGMRDRLGSSLVTFVGITVVVAVLVSVLAMSTSFKAMMSATGRADRAIVLNGGADSELSSYLSHSDVTLISNAAGIALRSDGTPVASAEVVSTVDLSGLGIDGSVTVRGVGPQRPNVRPELTIVEGKSFQAGKAELIVGSRLRKEFPFLTLGGRIRIGDSDWAIVGVFKADGGTHDAELVGDAESMLSTFHRDRLQSVTVLLKSDAEFPAFKAALTTNPRLSVEVAREDVYYRTISNAFGSSLRFVAYVMGGLMAGGALVGCLNTMYTSVSLRAKEMGTLRAIGFGNFAIVCSVMSEALLLAVCAAFMGLLLGYLAVGHATAATVDSNLSKVIFEIRLTPDIAMEGAGWALLIGFAGGLAPALRAVRQPIVMALRAHA